jgi:acylphosphatase
MLFLEFATLINWRELGLKQIHLTVFGNVQGVGFRYFSQMKAVQHQVKGWVRNRPDGSVEILAEANEDQLSHFIEEVRSGNPFSKVDDIDVHECCTPDGYTSFKIKY